MRLVALTYDLSPQSPLVPFFSIYTFLPLLTAHFFGALRIASPSGAYSVTEEHRGPHKACNTNTAAGPLLLSPPVQEQNEALSIHPSIHRPFSSFTDIGKSSIRSEAWESFLLSPLPLGLYYIMERTMYNSCNGEGMLLLFCLRLLALGRRSTTKL